MNKRPIICTMCKTPTDDKKTRLCPPCKEKNYQRLMDLELKKLETAVIGENFFPEIDKISEKVYLGNYDGQKNKDFLKSEGITHIIVCALGCVRLFPDEFTYLYLPIEDSIDQKISDLFEECFEFIEKSEKVYVHCQAGVSRSASIVIAYFIKKMSLSYDDAYALVAEKRRCIYPNFSFVKQLNAYARSIHSTEKQEDIKSI